jgi:hypothetical protein
MAACLQAPVRDGGCGALFGPFQPTSHSERRSVLGVSPSSGRTLPLHPDQLIIDFDSWRHSEFDRVYERSKDVYRDIVRMTSLLPIYEPGKVRVIGIQDGYESSCIQPFQDLTLKLWKKSKHSTMIPDLDETLIDRCNNSSLPYCLSVDYKSATDTMTRSSSAVGLDAFIGVMDCSNSGLNRIELISQFTSCILQYPLGEIRVDPDTLYKSLLEYELSPGLQRQGQRMGDRKSFAVLCLINLAVFMAALHIFLQKADLKIGTVRRIRRGVLKSLFVNGDDLSALVPTGFYEIWKPLAENVGWFLSPGKSYLSKSFLQINSRNYIRKNGIFSRIGYLNMKLVTGFNLKKNGEADADPEQLGRDLTEMVKFCPYSRPAVSKCMARFFESRFNKGFTPNWFLPVHMGGIGVGADVCEKDNIIVTKQQLKQAALFISDPKRHLTSKISAEIVAHLQLPARARRNVPLPIIDRISEVISVFLPTCRFLTSDEAQFGCPTITSDGKNTYTPSENLREIGPDVMGRISMISRWNLISSPHEDEYKRIKDYRLDWKSKKPMKMSKLLKYWEPRLWAPCSFDFRSLENFPTFRITSESAKCDAIPLDQGDMDSIPFADLDEFNANLRMLDCLEEIETIFSPLTPAQLAKRDKIPPPLGTDAHRRWFERQLSKHNRFIDKLNKESKEGSTKAQQKLAFLRSELLPEIHLA